MHPNAVFDWTDEEEMLRFVSERAFAHIFTGSSGQLFVVHAPVLVADGHIQFHLSRRNRVAGELAGRPVIVSVAGRDAYQSANWYASANQVPTWHYEAVEAEGTAREMDREELIGFLDRLSDTHERRVEPQSPWTRAKMEPGSFDAMVNAVIGFDVEPSELRGTRKFNQHKGDADRAATIAGQLRAGRPDIVERVSKLSSDE